MNESAQNNTNPIHNKSWTLSSKAVLQELNTSTEEGLTPPEVKKRLEKYGSNHLKEAKTKSAWTILADQIKNFVFVLLSVAAILAFAFGQWLEGVAIIVAIVLNVIIGFFTELKAVRSMEALHKISRVKTKVRRDGRIKEIPAEEVVPGDIVLLEGGDIIPADLRVLEASRMQVDESALIGESLPVGKIEETLDEDVPLAERKNMLYKGTALTSGSGKGIVVATGMNTELGRISTLTEEAESEETPLEKRLDRLGYRLIWITLIIAAVVAIVGLLVGKELFLIIETSIALAIAAIPEGLPIVATIALARGMWRMARRNALMNRLSAVETLGATNIICTDKTGTLTENQMQVTRYDLSSPDINQIKIVKVNGNESKKDEFVLENQSVKPSDHSVLYQLLEVGVLCNNAQLGNEESSEKEKKAVGDPLEVALLAAGKKAGIIRGEILETKPETREVAFDPELKMMATFHQTNGNYTVAAKGAPEAILNVCTHVKTIEGDREINNSIRQKWIEQNKRMAQKGLRILAMATKTVESPDAEPYESLSFLGLVGLFDPPREDVKPAIEELQGAGIRVVMVTGDQVETARNIGASLGLFEEKDTEVFHGSDFQKLDQLSEEEKQRMLKTPIFFRVTPEQKLNLVDLYQQYGQIVAMTGDGVNDAPALKKADIGVAMGQRGSQVAREAADMVLKDDRFNTITVAVEQGRIIFNNIRKFILYLLSGNMSEILIVGAAILAGAPLPILPLQILFLNMVSDVFPALALGVGKGDLSVMNKPPRDPQESILTRSHWIAIFGYGIFIGAFVLGSFALAFNWLQMNEDHAVTISFLTLAFARLWHVFNMRDWGTNLLNNEITRNIFVWGAIVICSVLFLTAVYVPLLSMALNLTDPGINGWMLVLAMSLIPTIIVQILKSLPIKPWTD